MYDLKYSVIGWYGGAGSVSANLYNISNTDLGATLSTAGGWVTGSFSFTASDTLTTLKLQNCKTAKLQNVSGDSTIDDVSIIATTVPEPSILALMGLGIFGIGLSRRKMKE